jgi:uncharacterized membrane protein YdjX (TVP38/TMEM64 family)
VELRDPVYRLRFSAWVKGLGPWGPAVLLGLQVLQIVVAAIPGGPVELIAGAAYGAWGGLLICVIGCLAASAGIYAAVRKYGLPMAERFFGKAQPWAFLKSPEKTARVVFITFLIPGVPKDMLTWFAPLSGLSLPSFLVISTFARMPAILCTAIMGDSLIAGNWRLFGLLFLITAAAGLGGIRLRGRLMQRNGKSKKIKSACIIFALLCMNSCAAIQYLYMTASIAQAMDISAEERDPGEKVTVVIDNRTGETLVIFAEYGAQLARPPARTTAQIRVVRGRKLRITGGNTGFLYMEVTCKEDGEAFVVY